MMTDKIRAWNSEILSFLDVTSLYFRGLNLHPVGPSITVDPHKKMEEPKIYGLRRGRENPVVALGLPRISPRMIAV